MPPGHGHPVALPAIATIALSRDLTIVTRNTRHFAEIPGLKVEDWTLAATG